VLTVLSSDSDDLHPSLPGDSIVPFLRARVRELILRAAVSRGDPTARIADVLHLWSAFNRNWLARLLPAVPTVMKSVRADSAKPARSLNLDPLTIRGDHRLQTVWKEVADILVERGRTLRGANLLPLGIEELLSEVYLVAARKWPNFEYHSKDLTVRWLLRILRNILRRTLHRKQARELNEVPSDREYALPIDGTGTQATKSNAEDREVIAARVLALNAALPNECRVLNVPDRFVARSTLQLIVAADTLETALRLNPENRRLWALLAIRQAQPNETAQQFGIDVNAMNVRFHRVRSSAIGLLAKCWAAADPIRS
jgi:DNA-directed RNA polymerase specialized sigma24 family protein